MLKEIAREIVHLLLPIHRSQMRFVKSISKDVRGCRVLEIGCGGRRDFVRLFEKNNDVVLSDVLSYPDCQVIDVTEFHATDEYDVILMMSVIEHVYDFRTAIVNIHRALKRNGVLVISVPFFYPLHDLPNDYWRFTQAALRRELAMFSKVTTSQSGLPRAPHSVHAVATK